MYKPEVTWAHPFLEKLLNEIPVETKSLVDLGCGRGIIGATMLIYRNPKDL
jgi:16S rRNA G1207 methylase RsmC